MTTAVLDVTQPEQSANSVGTELAVTTQALTTRLALAPITDTASLERAVEDRRAIGDAAKRVEEFFAPLKQLAHKLHKALCDRENAITGPLLQLDGQKKAAISAFKRAQDELRFQRERELAEQRRKEDQARAADEAAALETAGEPELAAAVLAEAIAAPVPVVSIVDATKAVVKFRRIWKWKYSTDEARALQLIPREFLCVDTVRLNKYATAMRESGKVPGVTFYYEDSPIR